MGDNDTLYIAMAGPHQLWAMSLADNLVFPFVGSGREGLLDGSLNTANWPSPAVCIMRTACCTLPIANQAASVSLMCEKMWFAQWQDQPRTTCLNLVMSMVSLATRVCSTRWVSSPGRMARCLWPTLTTARSSSLIQRQMRLKRASGWAAWAVSGMVTQREPSLTSRGGLDYADGRLYVADTNNHAIRVIDLAAGEVSTVTFPNPEMLQIADRPTVVAGQCRCWFPGHTASTNSSGRRWADRIVHYFARRLQTERSGPFQQRVDEQW